MFEMVTHKHLKFNITYFNFGYTNYFVSFDLISPAFLLYSTYINTLGVNDIDIAFL